MIKTLQIGNEVFEYPVQGENPSTIQDWGEEAAGWAEAVTDVLSNVFGPQDINLSTVSLSDNVVTPQNIVGLKFSVTSVIDVRIDYVISRLVGVNNIMENGFILGTYNGSVFSISQQCMGNSGIDIDVTNAGQFTYTSTNLGH